MKIKVNETKKATSKKAAKRAVSILNKAIEEKGSATFVMATGNSQLDFIQALVEDGTVDWSRTKMFHLDEYIGISETHRASFRKYLKERFISKVNPGEVNLINGDNDPEAECKRINSLIKKEEIDIAFIGIGENGHIAFNDPPADFETDEPFIVVDLDEDCRKQQVGEGWFDSLEDVPTQAVSMSVKQIMKSNVIINTVPGKRKAEAVKNCFGDWKVSPEYPASVLKLHDNSYTYLDEGSASLLDDSWSFCFK
ncbi:MAG: glucosamine-6-phosphate deaminase [Halanaerobiaceae bacterium]